MLMGLGFLTFSLPHFINGTYRSEIIENNVCNIAQNETQTDCSGDNDKIEDLSWNVWFFFIAQLLHGIGTYHLNIWQIHLCKHKFEFSLRRQSTLHSRSYLY
jgi:isopentenyldiphosphate isomerase